MLPLGFFLWLILSFGRWITFYRTCRDTSLNLLNLNRTIMRRSLTYEFISKWGNILSKFCRTLLCTVWIDLIDESVFRWVEPSTELVSLFISRPGVSNPSPAGLYEFNWPELNWSCDLRVCMCVYLYIYSVLVLIQHWFQHHMLFVTRLAPLCIVYTITHSSPTPITRCFGDEFCAQHRFVFRSVEKLYNSHGPELRRSLFSLKQLFQVSKRLKGSDVTCSLTLPPF